MAIYPIPNITNDELHARLAPPQIGIDWGKKITPNFTYKEWFDSVKAFPAEKKQLERGFPLDRRIQRAPQIVRDATGKPVYLGSSYRTPAWEESKDRDFNDHPKGKGVDLNGEDVNEILWEAYRTKNGLYKQLNAIGINAWGFYDWGVHLGTRPPKAGGADYFWDERKKKSSSEMSNYFLLMIPIIIWRKPIIRFIKKLFK